MKKVSWTPNALGLIALLFACLWLMAKTLQMLKAWPEIPDLVRIAAWFIFSMCTPFLTWWAIEFLAGLIATIIYFKRKP